MRFINALKNPDNQNKSFVFNRQTYILKGMDIKNNQGILKTQPG